MRVYSFWGSCFWENKLLCLFDRKNDNSVCLWTAFLINFGYSPIEIAERLGHESIVITERYSYRYPSVQQDMANRLDEVIKEEKKENGEEKN